MQAAIFIEYIHCPQACHQPQKSSVIFGAKAVVRWFRYGRIGWRVRCLGLRGITEAGAKSESRAAVNRADGIVYAALIPMGPATTARLI